jgi:hypothetical protein
MLAGTDGRFIYKSCRGRDHADAEPRKPLDGTIRGDARDHILDVVMDACVIDQRLDTAYSEGRSGSHLMRSLGGSEKCL